VYLWKDNTDPLTECPNDPAHTINPLSPVIVDELAQNTVLVTKETNPNVVTSGKFRVESLSPSIAALGNTATVTRTWPYPVYLYTFKAYVPINGVGFNVSVALAPNTTVGLLTASAGSGSATIAVSPTVLTNVTAGQYVSFNNGAGDVEIGEVYSKDIIANTLTLSAAPVTTYPIGTTVKVTTYAARSLKLPISGLIEFGADRTTAVGIPAGKALVVTYTNPVTALIAITTLDVIISFSY
jgi:hypothetical protein